MAATSNTARSTTTQPTPTVLAGRPTPHTDSMRRGADAAVLEGSARLRAHSEGGSIVGRWHVPVRQAFTGERASS